MNDTQKIEEIIEAIADFVNENSTEQHFFFEPIGEEESQVNVMLSESLSEYLVEKYDKEDIQTAVNEIVRSLVEFIIAENEIKDTLEKLEQAYDNDEPDTPPETA